jgi:hypothetical protein
MHVACQLCTEFSLTNPARSMPLLRRQSIRNSCRSHKLCIQIVFCKLPFPQLNSKEMLVFVPSRLDDIPKAISRLGKYSLEGTTNTAELTAECLWISPAGRIART